MDTFLIASKGSFDIDIDRRQTKKVRIPKYSNCYKVTIDRRTKTANCSCNYRLAMGMPCVHLITVVGKHLHPSMFHPRHYKTTNSDLYTDNLEIRSIIDTMFDQYITNPTCVPLGAIWDKIDFSQDYNDRHRDGTTLFEKRCMIGLWKMHENKVVFDRTDMSVLPSFFNVANLKDSDLNNTIDSQDDMGGFESMFTPEVKRRKKSHAALDDDIDLQVIKDATSKDHRTWWNEVKDEIQTVSKLCETVPDEKDGFLEYIRKRRRELQLKTADRMRVSGMIKTNLGSTIVSSNMPLETSPVRGRYLRGYESQRQSKNK